jgi:rubredoxin
MGRTSMQSGATVATSDGMTSWKCTICGFVDGGEAAPAHCPECTARDAMFVATDEPPHGIPHNPMQPHDERDQNGFVVGPGHGCLEND